MELCENNNKIIGFIVIIIFVYFFNIRIINFIIYKNIDLKGVCDYTQNIGTLDQQYLCITDDTVCILEYIRENGIIKFAQVSSFHKYLSNPAETSEILNYDASKWVLDSSLSEQILYDTKYQKKSMDDAVYTEIITGKCVWSGPKINKKFPSSGIVQTTILLQPRELMTGKESFYPFQYICKTK